MNQYENENEIEKSNPEAIYTQARQKRKLFAIIGIICIVLIEIALTCVFGFWNNSNSLSTRVLREFSLRRNGSLTLDTGTYSGDSDFGYFSGIGEFSFNTGAVYKGEWGNNELVGEGTLEIPVEGVYTGEFLNSKKEGTGTFAWDDGASYVGEWKDDQMWGQGIYTSPGGTTYSGTFQENTFSSGECTFENDTGSYLLVFEDGEIKNLSATFTDGSVYTGDCDEFGISGSGTMTFSNGDIYSGQYQENLRNGQGVYQWASGDQYDGLWANDRMFGTGTYTFANGACASGTFDSNLFTSGSYYIQTEFGDYTFTISNGEPTAVDMTLENGTSYIGDMEDGKLSGQAQILYSNGDKYSGQVTDGLKVGQGTYTWGSGASYDGQWNSDQMSGNGTYYYPSEEDGLKLVGTFEDGKPNGECTYYATDSEHYKTDWVAGECEKVYE